MTEDEIKEIGDFVEEMEALHARLENNPIMWRPCRPEEIMFDIDMRTLQAINQQINELGWK